MKSSVWKNFIDLQPPAPCDDCEHYDLCAAKELACTAFFAYTSKLNSYGRKKTYQKMVINKIPSREIYEKVFKDSEAELDLEA
jgi:hypothetical protein